MAVAHEVEVQEEASDEAPLVPDTQKASDEALLVPDAQEASDEAPLVPDTQEASDEAGAGEKDRIEYVPEMNEGINFHSVFLSQYLSIIFIDLPWLEFEPVFIRRVKSKYREVWSFAVLSQKSALDMSTSAEEGYDPLPNQVLFETNPLHNSDEFCFGGININTRLGKKRMKYFM